MSYYCVCGHSFLKKVNYEAHIRKYNCKRFIQSGLLAFQCDCGEYFKKEKYYKRHLETCILVNPIDVYVINLKHRTDRWKHMENTFGQHFNLHRVDAVKRKNGAVGCFMSHQKCIQLAKEQDMEYIIVLEDDCTLSKTYKNNIVEKLKETLLFLQKYKDWDIFTGGGVLNINNNPDIKKLDCKTNNLFKVTHAACAHFMIYKKSSYDFYLNCDPTNGVIDNIWWGKLKPIIVAPFFAYQMPGKSDIENIVYDSAWRKIAKTENWLQRLCNN